MDPTPNSFASFPHVFFSFCYGVEVPSMGDSQLQSPRQRSNVDLRSFSTSELGSLYPRLGAEEYLTTMKALW